MNVRVDGGGDARFVRGLRPCGSVSTWRRAARNRAEMQRQADDDVQRRRRRANVARQPTGVRTAIATAGQNTVLAKPPNSVSAVTARR